MREMGIGLVGVLVLALQSAPVQAQQAQTYTYDAYVFIDVSTDGTQDAAELQADGWALELYDAAFSALDTQTSSAATNTTLTSSSEASFVCIVPQTDWLQTTPVTTTNYPGDAAWYCHDIANVDADVFSFGVYQSPAEPETQPEIIDEGSAQPIEKETQQPEDEGAVLGETTDPDVLAETGVAAVLSPLLGIALTISVIRLARSSKVI